MNFRAQPLKATNFKTSCMRVCFVGISRCEHNHKSKIETQQSNKWPGKDPLYDLRMLHLHSLEACYSSVRYRSSVGPGICI